MEAALAEGDNTNEVHYYVALAELGLGNRAGAVSHAQRARELGYPEVFLTVGARAGSDSKKHLITGRADHG